MTHSVDSFGMQLDPQSAPGVHAASRCRFLCRDGRDDRPQRYGISPRARAQTSARSSVMMSPACTPLLAPWTLFAMPALSGLLDDGGAQGLQPVCVCRRGHFQHLRARAPSCGWAGVERGQGCASSGSSIPQVQARIPFFASLTATLVSRVGDEPASSISQPGSPPLAQGAPMPEGGRLDSTIS
jgi:hypothetical protein